MFHEVSNLWGVNIRVCCMCLLDTYLKMGLHMLCKYVYIHLWQPALTSPWFHQSQNKLLLWNPRFHVHTRMHTCKHTNAHTQVHTHTHRVVCVSLWGRSLRQCILLPQTITSTITTNRNPNVTLRDRVLSLKKWLGGVRTGQNVLTRQFQALSPHHDINTCTHGHSDSLSRLIGSSTLALMLPLYW